MPSPSVLPLFVATSLLLLIVPGPAVLFIVARSGAHGTRAGLASVLGVHAASVVHVVAAVGGLSALVLTSATAFAVVKMVGGLYLVVLGVLTLVGRRHRRDAVVAPSQPIRRIVIEGFVVNLLNPKVALFFLAFLPQFVRPERGAVWAQTLVLGGLYIVLGVVSDGVYAVAGARVGRWMSGRSRGRHDVPRLVEGSVLVGLGALTLAVPHRTAT